MIKRCDPAREAKDARRREAFRRWAAGHRKGDDPSGDQRPVEEVPTGVWLVLRYDEGDAGGRPIPDGEVFWTSPDIWITGGDADGNVVAGTPTGVHARVWNFGTFLAAPVRVDFRFVAPSIGIPWSAPQLIGSAWVNVPALGTAVADCPVPWVPADTGLVHACLIVTCNAPVMDPPDQPGDVKADRKTAQRNVTVVQADAGEEMRFVLQFARTSNARGPVALGAMMAAGDGLAAHPARGTGTLTRALRTLVRRGGMPEAPALARRALALHVAEGRAGTARLLPAEVTAKTLRVEGEGMGQGGRFRIATPEFDRALVTLGTVDAADPLRPQKLEVRLRAPDLREETAVHLLQFEEGAVTGGYTIVLRPRGRTSPTRSIQREDDMVTDKDDRDLQKHVIDQIPMAGAALELSAQLAEYLPIRSPDELAKRLLERPLSVRGVKIEAAALEGLLPEDAFPIESPRTLVRSAVAALGIGASAMRHGGAAVRNEAFGSLAAELAPAPAAPVGVALFDGPSVFGSKRADGEEN